MYTIHYITVKKTMFVKKYNWYVSENVCIKSNKNWLLFKEKKTLICVTTQNDRLFLIRGLKPRPHVLKGCE